MADHANDFGEDCYPSVARLSWKTGYSESSIRRIMRGLRQSGLIEAVANERGGRGKPGSTGSTRKRVAKRHPLFQRAKPYHPRKVLIQSRKPCHLKQKPYHLGPKTLSQL